MAYGLIEATPYVPFIISSPPSPRCKEIQAALTANAVKNIPDTLRELAHQNRVMQREMVLHKDSILETEGEIERLKAEIRYLCNVIVTMVTLPRSHGNIAL